MSQMEMGKSEFALSDEAGIDQLLDLFDRNGSVSMEFKDLDLDICRESFNGKIVDLITFTGKINNENSYDLNKKFHRFFSLGDGHAVIFDLSGMEFVNSTGIAILFSFFFRIQDGGGRVLFGGIHPFLRRVFGLMDLPGEITMFETLEEAKIAL